VEYFINVKLLFYVKWIIVLQLIMITLLVLTTYLVKIYINFKEKNRCRQFARMEASLTEIAKGKQELTADILKNAGKSISIVLAILSSLEGKFDTFVWRKVKARLVEEVLLPKARKLTKSRNWFKRHQAAQCFSLGKSETDDNNIIQLINDPVLLVSLNAATIALKYHSSPALINAVIDRFSKNRRLQQSIFARILSNYGVEITPFIIQRLVVEADPYVKAFCYRLLTSLPVQEVIADTAYLDVDAGNLELEITVLNYLAYNKAERVEEILNKKLNSSEWQIRAVSAKCLGQLHSIKSVALLAEKLNDSAWWVRINAAQALVKLGDMGIEILKRQSPEVDAYAYEAALQVLKINNLSM